MNDLVIAVASLVLGVVGSVAVSRYYYRRSFHKEITPYIQSVASPLKGVDPNVRRELQVTYQGHSIENLFEIQFLIANTGDKAVHDVIEPLTVHIPDGARLLDAAVLHVSPQGRAVTLQREERRVAFIASLLNSGDFFIAKLLLDGSPQASQFTFTITADELPPKLQPQRLPDAALKADDQKRQFMWEPLVGGLLLVAWGAAGAKLILNQWPAVPGWSDTARWRFAWELVQWGWAPLMTAIPVLVCLLGGGVFISSSFTGGSFPRPKNRFVVPKHLALFGRRSARLHLAIDE